MYVIHVYLSTYSHFIIKLKRRIFYLIISLYKLSLFLIHVSGLALLGSLLILNDYLKTLSYKPIKKKNRY